MRRRTTRGCRRPRTTRRRRRMITRRRMTRRKRTMPTRRRTTTRRRTKTTEPEKSKMGGSGNPGKISVFYLEFKAGHETIF